MKKETGKKLSKPIGEVLERSPQPPGGGFGTRDGKGRGGSDPESLSLQWGSGKVHLKRVPRKGVGALEKTRPTCQTDLKRRENSPRNLCSAGETVGEGGGEKVPKIEQRANKAPPVPFKENERVSTVLRPWWCVGTGGDTNKKDVKLGVRLNRCQVAGLWKNVQWPGNEKITLQRGEKPVKRKRCPMWGEKKPATTGRSRKRGGKKKRGTKTPHKRNEDNPEKDLGSKKGRVQYQTERSPTKLWPL